MFTDSSNESAVSLRTSESARTKDAKARMQAGRRRDEKRMVAGKDEEGMNIGNLVKYLFVQCR